MSGSRAEPSPVRTMPRGRRRVHAMQQRVARSLDHPVRLIAAAVVLRFGLAGLLGATQLVPHNGWFWANKDQIEYYATANALLHGAIAPIYTFMGYGTILAPFAVGSDFVLQVIPRIAVVQLLVAVPAAIALYRSGAALLDRRSAAVGTALWLTVPLWLSPIWFRPYSPPFNMALFWIGLQISVDYWAALLAIAVIAFATRARSDPSPWLGAAIGLAAGLAAMAKPTNAVLVASAAVTLWIWRRRRTAVVALATSAVVASAQLVLNWRISGRPFHLAYWSAWPYGKTIALASVAYIPRTFGKLFLLNYTGPLLMLGLLAALALTWRRRPEVRWLLVAPVVAYALSFSVLFYAISEFMLRFMTPALPALCLCCGAALTRPGAPVPLPRRPMRRTTRFALASALLASVGLAVFVGLAPTRPVMAVVPAMKPRLALSHGRGVVISWQAPSAAAKLTYRVNRSRGARVQSIWVGVRTTIHDRPSAGRWRYTVYIEPSTSPSGLPAGARDFARSPAAEIDVP